MLTRFNLTAKLGFGFGTVILLLAIVGAVGIYEVQTIGALNQKMYQHPFTVSNMVRKLDANIIRMHRAMKDIALAQNIGEMEHAIALVDRLETDVLDSFEIVQQRFLGDTVMVERTKSLVQEWKPIRDEVIQLMRQDKRTEAADITKGRGAVHVDRIIDAMRELTDFAQLKAIQFHTETKRTGRLLIIFLVSLIILSIVISMVFTSYVTRSITVPAREIIQVSNAIARGDFSKTITYASGNEMGEMATSLRRMLTGVVGKGQSIINSIPIHFWTADTNFNLTFINDMAANAVGLPPQFENEHNAPPLTISQALRDDEAITFSLAQRSLSTGRRMKHEVRYTRNDSTTHLYQVISPLRGNDGEFAGVMGFALDISQHKKSEEDLRVAIEAAKQASRAKGEFLSNMSHEIRTPLSGIHGMLQLLQDSPVNKEQEQWISMALASEKSLLTVINDILDLSRLEAGRLELSDTPFSLIDSLETVINTFKIQADSQGIDLRYELDPGLPKRISGDETRLRQVLFNLVGNAIKFTPSGEIILKAFLYEEQSEVLTLGFTVSDTGIGIPKDRLEDIFREFVQVHSTCNRNYQGSGLGLTIVKQLITLMRGDITIDSTPRLGTTVRLTARFGKAQDLDAELQEELETPVTHHLRILVAEDDRINQMAIVAMLEKSGHHVLAVNNGHEAVKAFQSSHYDCILMDIQMPQVDGLEATKIIREQYSKDIPIIALTAHAMKGDRESFIEQGLSDYISKPINMEKLHELLSQIAPQSQE
ncbi:response regulator [Desulfovibrio ferrophilus]|uniref:histidine kinase n=1 Tax=Desulfovibrio ferrophilus TaxID=241368 RepID=A0A2Z6AXT0_9BACT|nr:response regulator [Desulfovibrio ferrophilus]BBD08064.1 PAS sensor protein [Desulfovibrio ferrophilus]